MTTTHECGHILGGMICGAKLVDFDLAPWRLPYSIHSPDPYPLFTLWAGPIFGAIAPITLLVLFRTRFARFIGYFCLVANGCYLAVAWYSGDSLLDTQRLLDAGAHPATIVVFCLITIGIGYSGLRRECMRLLRERSTQENDGPAS